VAQSSLDRAGIWKILFCNKKLLWEELGGMRKGQGFLS
jgi:hypothetical protein